MAEVNMIKKIVITGLLFFLIVNNSLVLAQSELEKLAKNKFSGEFKPPTVEDIDEILIACKKDIKSQKSLTEKEKDICLSMSKAESSAKKGYQDNMDACSYQKLADSTRIMPSVYDQMAMDCFVKNNAVRFINSQNLNDIIKFSAYEKLCINQITKKIRPYYLKECMKEIPFDKAYRQRILNNITFQERV